MYVIVGYLISLFVAGMIGLSLRFIILDKFELYQLAILLVFPVVAVLLYFFLRNQTRRDQAFQPFNSEGKWMFRLGNAITPNWKPIYAHQQCKGNFRRIYRSPWKMFIADIMRSTGRWYLNLEAKMENGDHFAFVNQEENKLWGNDQWILQKNGEAIGRVQTDLSMKNASKLKGLIEAIIEGKQYKFQTYGVSDTVEVYADDRLIGRGIREKGYQFTYQPTVEEADHVHLMLTFILVTFYFHT
ncbi:MULTISPECIES: hypothetical protein [Allobacillus]|uniref:Tubby C-terminal domain-containing protein n=1 Tax=Allobacillus salarius TaxID=1955272 RepID=A0A556PGF2_9BACI|nr:hypothetical protein [Allobacillus salarius]TSJ63472.1 hypothetical protein FPQ13_09045 [Allobacillus salarius]